MQGGEGEWEGREKGVGLITPNRSKQVLTSRFSSPYAISEETGVVFLANTTDSAITIKKGSQVAEFHPRDETAFSLTVTREREKREETRMHKRTIALEHATLLR